MSTNWIRKWISSDLIKSNIKVTKDSLAVIEIVIHKNILVIHGTKRRISRKIEETLVWINEQTYRSTRTKVPRA